MRVKRELPFPKRALEQRPIGLSFRSVGESYASKRSRANDRPGRPAVCTYHTLIDSQTCGRQRFAGGYGQHAADIARILKHGPLSVHCARGDQQTVAGQWQEGHR